MKILVVSLLRLGDIIQQKRLLSALAEKYVGAEIHLLLNKQFASVESLFDSKQIHFHYFDRDLLQRSMGEASFNLFFPLQALEELIQELNAEDFDLILNWTHNRLSAFLIGAIQGKAKQGLWVQEGKLQGLESRWLRYFNDNFSENGHSFFHYTELLGKAFDLPVHRSAGKHNSSNLILLQCFTSDIKKNWPLRHFAELRTRIRQNFLHLSVRVLATPEEKNALLEFFRDDEIIVCDLAAVQSLLSQAAVLICGDTSIKHLAVESGTRTVEIALGGSNASKTGAFSERAFLVEGKAPCYPCLHSQKCPQKSHLCAESVSIDEVFASFQQALSDRKMDFLARPAQVERAIWSSYLNQAEEIFNLAVEEAQALDSATEILWQYQESFESCENFNEIYNILQVISDKGLDTGFYFQKLSQVFVDRYSSAESAFSALKRALEQSRELLLIRKKLIDQTLSKDGGNYAERT